MYLPLMAIVALVVAVVARTFQVAIGNGGPERSAPFVEDFVRGHRSTSRMGDDATNAEYRSGLTLWQTVLDRWPPHARAHRNLAAELKLANRPDEEIVHLRAAVKDLPDIRNLLGLELLALGRNTEAADELRLYVRDNPRDADAWSTWATRSPRSDATTRRCRPFTRGSRRSRQRPLPAQPRAASTCSRATSRRPSRTRARRCG